MFPLTHLEQKERCYDVVGHMEIVSGAGFVQREPFQREDELHNKHRERVIVKTFACAAPDTNNLRKINPETYSLDHIGLVCNKKNRNQSYE